MVLTLNVLKENKVCSYEVTLPLFQGLYVDYVKVVDHKIDCYASTHEEWFDLYLHHWPFDPIVSAPYNLRPYQEDLVIKSWNYHWQSAHENQFCNLRRQTIHDIIGITATKEQRVNGNVVRECLGLASTHNDAQKSDLLVTPTFLKKAFQLGFEFMREI